MPTFITRANTNYQLEGGIIWLWGENTRGALGDQTRTSRSSPVQTVAGGTNWKEIASGTRNAAGIKTDGTLWLWGSNSQGELGDGTITHRSSPVQTIAGGTNWKDVVLASSTFAIKTDGTLWVWGNNGNGILGDGTIINRSSPVQTIAGGNNWQKISSGILMSGAIKNDGTLWVWGNNGNGILGDGTITHRSSPVQTIAGGNNWKEVSGGYAFTATIKTDGTLWTWGQNTTGALGDGTVTSRSSPVQTIAGGTNWRKVGSGSQHVSAIKDDGTLWTWGWNQFGQLGDETVIHRSSPVQTISGGTNWTELVRVAGDGSTPPATSFAIKSDRTLWAWGRNNLGQIGDSTITNRSSPVQIVAGSSTWKKVQIGSETTIALADYSEDLAAEGLVTREYIIDVYPSLAAQFKQAGLWGWGTGSVGSLGGNNATNRSSPVQTIAGGSNWEQVSAGDIGAAAIKSDGTLWLWGFNNFGQIGDGTVTNRSSPVQTLSATTNWKQVSRSSSTNAAAVKTDGTLWVWGANAAGQLGTNNQIDRSSPVQTVSGGANWKQISVGNGSQTITYMGAIKTDGTLWMWGYGPTGALGNNSIVSRSSPVQTVVGGTNWKQVSCGQGQTGAIKTDGTLWMWGSNANGQLGNGTRDNKSSPIQIGTNTNWKEVSCGTDATAAIKTDGTLWNWGRNQTGQLGDGTLTSRSSPIQTIAGGTNWKQVSMGDQHTTSVKTDGTLWSWGQNSGGNSALGDDTSTNKSSPVQTIAGGYNWKQVSAGTGLTFCIRDDSDDPI